MSVKRIVIGSVRKREGMLLTFRDHEMTRVPSTQPTTTKLPRFSAWRAVLCNWGKAVNRVRDTRDNK